MKRICAVVLCVGLFCVPKGAARAATVEPLPAPPVPNPSRTAVPLTTAQLKDPHAAMAAARRFVGEGAWKTFGSAYTVGFMQTQGQSLPFTSMVDLRTGYSRTIILLPLNAGTYEFGIDKDGSWSVLGYQITAYQVPIANLKAALYINRFGFINAADQVTLKEVGLDQSIGDRISITPSGGAPLLAIIKPETALVSAVQFGSGQIDVYADYLPVSGVLYPYREMQGTDPTKLSVFQANNVVLSPSPPEGPSVTRPSLPPAESNTPAGATKP